MSDEASLSDGKFPPSAQVTVKGEPAWIAAPASGFVNLTSANVEGREVASRSARLDARMLATYV